MTGKGILEAMSFVDDKYIEEAETGTIHNQKNHMIKVLLPLAACLCVAFLARYPGSGTESAVMDGLTENSAVEQEAMPEMETCYKKDDSFRSESDIALDEEIKPCVSEVPTLILRIEAWTGQSFTATVAEHVDTDLYPLGTVLQVEMLPSICIETAANGLVSVERRVPTEADFPTGSQIRVRFTASVDKEYTIFIESICKED